MSIAYETIVLPLNYNCGLFLFIFVDNLSNKSKKKYKVFLK